MQKKSNAVYYVYLFLVVALWSVSPLVDRVFFFDHFSATVYVFLGGVVTAISFTVLSVKKFKLLNKQYFKVACITGACYSLATISQKIGLQYTTPSMYAFLENTSCIIVPLLMLFMFRKKPALTVGIASVVCLVGCFVLSGGSLTGGFGIGNILCALAGVLYSGNIVGTGVYAKNMDAVLYLMIQKWVSVIMSLGLLIALHFIRPGGEPLEKIVFDFNIPVLLFLVVHNLIVGSFCWILRTVTVTKLDVTMVTIVMSTPAVFTAIISVCLGLDTVSVSLVLGATLIFGAVLLSGSGDKIHIKRRG